MESSRLTAADGQVLAVYALEAAQLPKAVVCIVHGLGEHGKRYSKLAEALNEQGFHVLTYDQRGHGLTEGARGDAQSVRQLASDANELLLYAAQRYPDLPLFLFGHSMGGNIALGCLLRYQPQLAGLILSSPWLQLAFTPPKLKEAAGRLIARLWPSFTISNSLSDADLYQGNEKQSSADRDDQLRHDRISARLYFSVVDEGARLLEELKDIHIPVLLYHGTEDKVTSFAASRKAAELLGGRCTFIPVEGGYHELHFDKGHDWVSLLLADWMKSKC